jgi:hypothetical protein
MEITLIISLTVLVIFFVAARTYLNYINPYTEEIIRELKIWTEGFDKPTATKYHIKRTYKNGKVEIVKKKL